ncbi:MAG: hypothetical protein ACK5JT_19220, partial [Hyphomicrobiaceae bacterium]
MDVLGLACSQQVENTVARYLRDASYSIYLVQMITIPAYYKVSSRFLAGWDVDVVAVGCLVASVLFGCLVYALAERPMTARLRR